MAKTLFNLYKYSWERHESTPFSQLFINTHTYTFINM